jgi:hypothetical protein
MSAPERIWAASVTENYGEWQTTTDGLPRPTEYVRADLYAALEAQFAEVDTHRRKILAENERLLHAFIENNRTLSALEATPPAPKATDHKDPVAIRAHAARVLERMNRTPYGPKRKLLATQHVDLTNEALRAEGWNEALTAALKGD